jgi:hypothetical protein
MNLYLIVFFVLWAVSWLIIILDGGRTLPYAPADRFGFFMGEVVTAIMVFVLIWLSRNRKPIDHRSDLPIRQTSLETVALLLYLVLIAVIVGPMLGVRPHIGSAGLDHGSMHAWSSQTVRSVMLWAGFYFCSIALIPFLVFTIWRGYSLKSMLLNFPEPKKWIPYSLITAVISLGAFVGPAYFKLPLWGHLLTFLLFSLGTFIPVAILIQGLLAPRLAILTKSWISGSMLAGVTYGLYHSREFYLEWGTASQVAVSLAWITQLSFFGVLKAVSTLRTGNAWIHIFNTHMPHLSEAPEIVRIFSFK